MGEANQGACDLSSEASSASASTGLFVPPSIDCTKLLSGDSYSYFSPHPPSPNTFNSTSRGESPQDDYLVLGIDEAGRGPVLGPMVYSAFYLPHQLQNSLLSREYKFDDSKVLTPGVRMNLMRLLCTPGNPLFESCGWATKLLSARDISSGMLRPGAGSYNLNAQAMDATVEILRGIVEERSMNVREVYIDTIGNPVTYQQKLEKLFPSLKITVAKKADSLYPCVSAASVAAKVTRDVALELCHEEVSKRCDAENNAQAFTTQSWGSGYPSDSKSVSWLRNNMDPIFGWGNECRFSWGTAKEMLEVKGGFKVDWPEEEENLHMKDFLLTSAGAISKSHHEVREWYGSRDQS
ncbi:ribonuclease H2 catalytic subunit RNH201 [Aspergillus homomorphus CBS 101889]|uniref:Ribonuclease n=1 Tax=Aspergillus homomorphus (strain CBS 101889) TaxID=1450537 RepID=A0A395HS39_ASPHC|nr:ribonuclease H2 subunit A [Aspergillus homomorphus CBS 101889]RAL10771.1 ribonuclease H2 subunit A [Aspergillus homomorphus CBS 101889]